MEAHERRFEVELHSTAPEAIEAVNVTLSMMPGGGKVAEDCGRWFIVTTAATIDFLKFAVANQGYVKKVL